MKIAFITGVTGQDGSYLSELLLSKDYVVYGLVRRTSGDSNLGKINHLIGNPNFHIINGDITDYNRLNKLLNDINPDEIYNLAAQSHVQSSFEFPYETCIVNGFGVLNILNIIKDNNLKSKFYQASTSELFGNAPEIPQTENDKFYPCSPYACAKLFAYWITINYRESYGLFACNGILFNHTGPRRGNNFVTKKIVRQAIDILDGKRDYIELGNIYSKRDWGYAPEYVEAMWSMLQQDKPDDYIVSTGETHTIKEFVEESLKNINIDIKWYGNGINEIAIDNNGRTIVKISKEFYRPSETEILIGDYSKANKIFKFEPKVKFKELVKIMIDHEKKERGI
jgi:GDPmannose 4,6-dehydratase